MVRNDSQHADRIIVCDVTKKLVNSSSALIGDGQVDLDVDDILQSANPIMKVSAVNPDLDSKREFAELFNYAFLCSVPEGADPSFGKCHIYHIKSRAYDEKSSYFKPMAQMLDIYDCLAANTHNNLSDAIVMGDAIHSWVRELCPNPYQFRFPDDEVVIKRSTRTQLPRGRYSFIFISFILIEEEQGKFAHDCIMTKVHLDVEAEGDTSFKKKKRTKKETDDVAEELER